MHSQFKTTLTKYCTSCHATEKVNLLIDVNSMWFDMGNDDDKYAATVARMDHNYEGELPINCAFCGSHYTMLLDEKIGDVIAELNIKGYKTWFSCDGGHDKYEDALPYISFDYATTPLDIFYSLPDGWSMACDADFEMYANADMRPMHYISIYYDYIDTNWDKEEMLNWANGLPINDNNPDMRRVVKHPGERYQLEDIKTAFEYRGYSVSFMKAFQLSGKWICIIKFDESVYLPIRLFDDTAMISNCEIAIMLDNISTDHIHSIVDKICTLSNL